MDSSFIHWTTPGWFIGLLPTAALLWWLAQRSLHPMSRQRRRWQLVARAAAVVLALAILAGPIRAVIAGDRAVVFVLDHSASQGPGGQQRARAEVSRLAAGLPGNTWTAVVSAGDAPVVLRLPERGMPKELVTPPAAPESDLAAAVELARGLFPPDTARTAVLISDGLATRGDAASAARDAALAGIVVHARALAGDVRPDLRVVTLRPNRVRSHEGASITLTAEIESSLTGSGVLRLFENGIEVEARPLTVTSGDAPRVEFRRTPAERNLYTYRVVAQGFAGDTVPENDQALALVDVDGRPRLLHVSADPGEAHYLIDALTKEGIRIDPREPGLMPDTPQDLAAYDGVILADVPARLLSERAMAALKDYVEDLGGGLIVAGGTSSFGVGGYFRTPLEELLPVQMQSPDTEEQAAVALALVVDRSGSMSGEKLEFCKTASVATASLMANKDYLGVVAFDSSASWIVPMARMNSRGDVERRIRAIAEGGGTNIYPGMTEARAALARTPAKVRHMIVLTDGISEGSGYPQLAAACRADRITISTVAVGSDADAGFLQSIAAAGGGKFYLAQDPRQVPRIFTQDAMTHLGKLVREQPFKAKKAERHPMIEGWDSAGAPQLLGYVRTNRRSTAQVPLVTDIGDPLLAHWRFGLGKVTAFTSDSGSRWSSLWLANWPSGYVQLWSQIVRETVREPQGRHLDLRLDEAEGLAQIHVDAREDAVTFRNGATVEADVFHIAVAGSSALRPLLHTTLTQVGPGRYLGSFRPDKAGVYLVRVRGAGELVSAGLVHNPGAEVASGRVDLESLARIAHAGDGQTLSPTDELPIPPPAAAAPHDLRPWFLIALMLALLADLVLRRWENVLGVWERLSSRS